MSLDKAHWTDAEITAFALSHISGVFSYMRRPTSTPFQVTTFFLNPATLNSTGDEHSLEEAVRYKLKEMLPPSLYAGLPKTAAQTFLGLGDLLVVDQGKVSAFFSRPNDQSTLSERVAEYTGIKAEDMGFNTPDTVYGFDNLSMMLRLFEVMNSYPNGGQRHLKQQGQYGFIQYRSMLGARRQFLEHRGDFETLRVHEAALHIGAFTKGRIPFEYVGFYGDIGMNEKFVSSTYAGIFQRLLALGHTAQRNISDNVGYDLLSPENLLCGLSDILDENASQISANDGADFRNFYNRVTAPEALDDAQHRRLSELTVQELLHLSTQFVVFQTLRGLKTLMGDNTLKYIPERNTGTMQRVSHLLTQHYS